MEVAKSVDDLMTSQSIERHAFLDFEILDAKIASPLKRIITNQYFSHAQKYERFQRGRQIALNIYEHFSSYRRS